MLLDRLAGRPFDFEKRRFLLLRANGAVVLECRHIEDETWIGFRPFPAHEFLERFTEVLGMREEYPDRLVACVFALLFDDEATPDRVIR